MRKEIGDGGSVVYGLAPWAMRRGRLVQLALVGGGIAVAAAILGVLNGTEGFGFGIVLAATTLGLSVVVTWYLRRMKARVRLVVGAEGVEYDAGTHRIAAGWEDVVAVDLVIRGADTGPALVLRGDHAVSGGRMLGVADIGEAIQGTGLLAPSLKSTIPLSWFIQGKLAGSPLGADLRGHIPELVDAYLARHGGAPTR